MTLSPEEKLARKRERMIEKAREYQIGTYARKFVASLFQQVVRAEAAIDPRPFITAVVDGEITQVPHEFGFCTCVTCGKSGPWKGNSIGGGVIESGHFIASRRMSILFEETGVNPQCKHCNQHLSGNQGCYEIYMRFMYGQKEIDRLRKLKNETVSFTRETLVDMRLSYQARLKEAVQSMTKGEPR